MPVVFTKSVNAGIEGQWGWWHCPKFQDIKLGGPSILLYAALGVPLWWAYAHG